MSASHFSETMLKTSEVLLGYTQMFLCRVNSFVDVSCFRWACLFC